MTDWLIIAGLVIGVGAFIYVVLHIYLPKRPTKEN